MSAQDPEVAMLEIARALYCIAQHAAPNAAVAGGALSLAAAVGAAALGLAREDWARCAALAWDAIEGERVAAVQTAPGASA